MSHGERFFSPASMLRVVRAVEWEPELEFYRDGTSNQGRFMEALAMLWGRWIKDESLSDLVDLAEPVVKEEWIDALAEIILELPQKARQIVGFWRGMGGSLAAPKLAAGGLSLFGKASVGLDLRRRVYFLGQQVAVELASIVDEAREV